MKTGFKKSLALLLAVFMAFGAAPFALGIAVFAADDDYMLKSISITPDEATVVQGETLTLQVSGAYVNRYNPTDITSKSIKNDDVLWTSSDSTLASVSSEGVVTASKICESVTITAFDKTDSSIKNTCVIKVTKAPTYVESITWNWAKSALLVGATYEITESDYTMIPDKPDNAEVELTCSPASALQIAADGKSFKVNPLPTGSGNLVVTLTLTAKGAGKDCKPATKQMTVLADIPLGSVKWDYVVGSTGITLFKYWDDSASKKKNFHPYKYTAYDKDGRPLDASALSLCDIKITSADNRIVRPYDACQYFIPVGNGMAEITITIKTPKGVTRSDTIKVKIDDSPYTPITVLGIGYDEKNTDVGASFDSASNTVTLMYTHGIQLTAQMDEKAKLDQDAITVATDDGESVKIVSKTEYKWSSSDESVATVDKNGKVTCVSKGNAVITLTVNDGGKEFVKTVNIKGTMSWWQIVIAVFFCIITGNWGKIGNYI